MKTFAYLMGILTGTMWIVSIFFSTDIKLIVVSGVLWLFSTIQIARNEIIEKIVSGQR
jgi:hypothetical protein